MEFNLNNLVSNRFDRHLLKRGREYDYVWCGLDIDIHRHEDFYELFILACGDFYHYHNGEERLITKNTVFFFKPGESHGLRRALPQNSHFSFFGTENFFKRFFEENFILQNAFKTKNYLSAELTDVEYDYIYRLANLLSGKENEYQKVSLLLYSIISILMLYDESSKEDTTNGYVLDCVEKMNDYTYLTTKIKDIYSYYPVAQCTLSKDFKAYTGMTLIQYQKKQKLAYAAQLLENTKCQITEIAEILEIDSFSHFLRIFKEEYGVSPKEYRKKKKKQ